MKIINRFDDVNLCRELLGAIEKKSVKNVTFMEVCGTHTMSIYKNGIDKLIPSTIKLISGPGCPVCVTPQGIIDSTIKLSQNKDIIIATFGDMMRVPGSNSSLLMEKAKGADVRVIYSPLDVIDICLINSNKEVVFFAIGFETTAPTIALLLMEAQKRKIENLSIIHSIKQMPKAMEALVLQNENNIDGFICPGHVGTIIGIEPFSNISNKHNVPMVMSGFEVVDILGGILKLLDMVNNKKYTCENLYGRVVNSNGNKKAKEVIDEVFSISASQWRGIGEINGTGYKLNEKFKVYDAYLKFGIEVAKNVEIQGCICGDILKGKSRPKDCLLFGKVCTPSNPIGPCMVSYEGCCSNIYKYGV